MVGPIVGNVAVGSVGSPGLDLSLAHGLGSRVALRGVVMLLLLLLLGVARTSKVIWQWGGHGEEGDSMGGNIGGGGGRGLGVSGLIVRGLIVRGLIVVVIVVVVGRDPKLIIIHDCRRMSKCL